MSEPPLETDSRDEALESLSPLEDSTLNIIYHECTQYTKPNAKNETSFPCIFENVTNFEIPAHPKILGYLEMNNEYNICICKQSAIRVATNFSVGLL